ncbi:N-lysine methyltransferase KMT5A-like [Pseudochaenichthys georgianus]|uniref:N-lysine methyltransferase KMT5A-like n=1 Tax=Pseudochaenichthys georgianus TaxID=52239 RepID=UPI00146DA7D8|nr:N-lysine methyltransferase KMT5A-like isoform X1 [Pseudochaenichthys georgianus]
MQRSVRKRRLGPQQDAEQHIKLRTEEHFIDQFKGRGVFAAKVFTKGEFVLEYRGKLYNQDDVNTKNYRDTEATFLFDLKWDGKCLCLDASVEDKSLGRLVNDDHKMPNCKMRTIVLDGMPHLCLFALSDIAPEEEIFYNYGDADWPWRKQFQVTTEQYYPDAEEEETFP